MKVDDVKPTETTEEVSSHGVEKRVKRRESHRNTPGAREPMANWKNDRKKFLQIGRAG
jgi:hypothetical protein